MRGNRAIIVFQLQIREHTGGWQVRYTNSASNYDHFDLDPLVPFELHEKTDIRLMVTEVEADNTPVAGSLIITLRRA